MKTYALLVVCLLVGGLRAATAQTQKGRRLAGVNVGNITLPTSGGSGSIISLQPTYGWFVADNLVVGAGVPFFNVSNSGTRATQIGLTPFLRYYLSPASVKPFLGASVGVVNTSASAGANSASSTDAIYSATGGVAFFLNPSVSFDLGLTYTGGDTGSLNTLLAGSSNALTPNIPQALNLSLGFQVYFGGQ
ncbi:outer membrane beta-barrel protein [Fibrella forsythiae]|uniref:Outer membrane beta-barrel protein n=1 Tax=Fibrella forsythiae TaxID=2817061 RepID=A0ABS3JT37_9BACT|nr:outer membrane beta-barrel protein [Fibrella forsythiae]MBO0953166.1 outer membrane beta-barrel protein [Fibrella forsythiae]